MKTIYKYELTLSDVQQRWMPKDAQILTVQMQEDTICVWAIIDTESETELRMFQIFGTGHEMPNDSQLNYIGTIQKSGLVWHIFEKP